MSLLTQCLSHVTLIQESLDESFTQCLSHVPIIQESLDESVNPVLVTCYSNTRKS